MKVSTLLLSIVTLLYVGVSIFAFKEGSYGKGVVFAGYTLANLGFILFE
jgi:hypothetical protein